jgi:SNF2 family DNA or RNA helicase
VHRIGQRRGVQVFKLITENTLEEKIDSIIARKKRLMDSVVQQDDKTLLKHFSREDLIELMSFSNAASSVGTGR